MNNLIGTKSQAVSLRKLGQSYNEISKKLGVAKSTLSYWLKDIPESLEAKTSNINRSKEIWSKNITDFNKKRSREYQQQTAKETEGYAKQVGELSKQDLFMLGIGLYLAEGSKREKFKVRFTNSDPEIIKIIMRFFLESCEVKESDIKARIHLHNPENYDNSLEFWSKLTSISKENFWQPQFVVSKSSQRKRPFNRLPNGILHLTISSSSLSKKIRGWSDGVREKFVPR